MPVFSKWKLELWGFLLVLIDFTIGATFGFPLLEYRAKHVGDLSALNYALLSFAYLIPVMAGLFCSPSKRISPRVHRLVRLVETQRRKEIDRVKADPKRLQLPVEPEWWKKYY